MKVKYLYAGKRLSTTSEIFHCFLDEQGVEHYWRKMKNVYIGSSYWGQKDKMSIQPERITDETQEIICTQKQLEEFEAKNLAAEEFIKAKREKIRIKRRLIEKSRTKRIKDLRREFLSLTKSMAHTEKVYFIEGLLRGFKW